MRTLLLHNPKAGNGTPHATELEAALSKSGCAVECLSTKGGDWKESLGENWDLIAIAGGDGTVAKVIRRLPNRQTPIAILPIGTANNIARSLGLTQDPVELAAKLGGAPARPLDTGRAKGPWGERAFIEAVGFGALAEAIDRAGPKPPLDYRIAHGREALCQFIAEAVPYPFALSIDDETIEGDFLFVEILNLSFSGPRLPFAHLARPGDQLLDVVLLAEAQREAVIGWIGGKPEAEPPPFGLRQGRRVSMTFDGAPIRIDDRSYDTPSKPATAELRLEDESLKVLCPAT